MGNPWTFDVNQLEWEDLMVRTKKESSLCYQIKETESTQVNADWKNLLVSFNRNLFLIVVSSLSIAMTPPSSFLVFLFGHPLRKDAYFQQEFLCQNISVWIELKIRAGFLRRMRLELHKSIFSGRFPFNVLSRTAKLRLGLPNNNFSIRAELHQWFARLSNKSPCPGLSGLTLMFIYSRRICKIKR